MEWSELREEVGSSVDWCRDGNWDGVVCGYW